MLQLKYLILLCFIRRMYTNHLETKFSTKAPLFAGVHYETGFVSPFRLLEFFCGSQSFVRLVHVTVEGPPFRNSYSYVPHLRHAAWIHRVQIPWKSHSTLQTECCQLCKPKGT